MNLKSRLIIYLIVICGLFAPGLRASDVNTNDHLISLKLNNVDYHEAEIEVEFYLNEKHGLSAFLGVKDFRSSSGYRPHQLKPGYNRFKVYILRDKKRDEGFTTKQLEVTAYPGGQHSFFSENIDIEIQWPGMEATHKIIGGMKVEYNDFSSINHIQLDRNMTDFKNIYKQLLAIGAPLYKLGKFGSDDTEGDHLHLNLGKNISPKVAKRIVSSILQSTDSLYSVGARDLFGDSGRNIFLGRLSRAHEKSYGKISEVDIRKLKSPDISDDEFYEIFGYSPPSKEKNLDELLETAHKLIDTGIRANLERAKTILNEIIVIDPNYPQAYLELARYYMNRKHDGYYKAEKPILIAKEIDPKLADTRVLLGFVYTNQGRFEEAEKEYVLAEQLGTNNLWLYANWGLNYQEQGMHQDAIEKYSKVISSPRLNDRNDRPKRTAHSRIVKLLIDEKRYQEADQLYTRFSNEFPGYNKCNLYEQAELRIFYLGDYQKSIDSYLLAKENGCDRDGSILSAAYYLKWSILFEGKQVEEAKIAYRQAEVLTPDDTKLLSIIASSSLTAKIIPFLLDKGKDIDAVNREGFTALGTAVSAGEISVVRNLLKFGADVNYRLNDQLPSPFMLAVVTGNKEIVQMMLNYSPDLTQTLPNGISLDKWARENGLKEISDLIQLHHRT